MGFSTGASLAFALAHVPDPKRHLVFYFGAYSNVARGKRKKAASALQAADELAPAEEIPEEQAARRRSWARLIRRAYEVDPLVCPKCRGEMRVVAVILDAPAIWLAHGSAASGVAPGAGFNART